MAVETATYIKDLNSTYPLSSDGMSEGDNHIRLIKQVLLSTFPNLDAAFTGKNTDIGNPVGSVQMYAGSAAPTGWLMCDGTAVSRTTYSALYAVIGTTYGAGDGTTTFNLPDLKDKFIKGKNADALAATGGTASHSVTSGSTDIGGTFTSSSDGSHTHTGTTGSTALTTAQIPAHTHTVTTYARADGGSTGNPGHSELGSSLVHEGGGHTFNSTTGPAKDGYGTTSSVGSGSGHTHTIGSDGAHTHTVTISGAHTHTVAFDNRPPFVTMNYIIKT